MGEGIVVVAVKGERARGEIAILAVAAGARVGEQIVVVPVKGARVLEYRIANIVAAAAPARVVEGTITSTIAAGVRVAGTEIAIVVITKDISLAASLTLITNPPSLIPAIY